MKYLLLLITTLSFFSCKKNDTAIITPLPTNEYYYPPLTGSVWDTKTAASLNWDDAKLTEAFDYAGTKSTYGLIVLHHGKIVKEQYWNGWTTATKYAWNSAGKSMVATMCGIAQQDGILNINNKTSTYLGTGWTSLPLAKENLITVKHNLTMTTGLDDNVPDDNCMTPSCLIYKADAGTRWAYHNAPYRLLQDILGNVSGKPFSQYTNEKLFYKIGINNATWLNYVLYTTTRDAARFGSFILSKGSWNGSAILSDAGYFNSMTNTSQNYNLSYGYLWWLNGKASAMAPGSQIVYPVSLASNAPADMLMALGKDDKKIYVIPSLDVVVVRLGDNASGTATLGPSSFDNELWGKFKLAMKY
jgi:CubicO group peptidase (beta-lactamase class C family)